MTVSLDDVRRCTQILEAVISDRGLLSAVPLEDRRALLTAGGAFQDRKPMKNDAWSKPFAARAAAASACSIAASCRMLKFAPYAKRRFSSRRRPCFQR